MLRQCGKKSTVFIPACTYPWQTSLREWKYQLLLHLPFQIHHKNWKIYPVVTTPLTAPLVEGKYTLMKAWYRQPIFQLHIPILYQTITFRRSYSCLRMDIMGYKVPSLVWMNDGWLSKLVQYVLFQFFCSTLNTCIYYRVSKALSRISQFQSLGVPQGYQHQSHLPVMIKTFHEGVCHTATCSLCLFL